jgi:DNA modification methylase
MILKNGFTLIHGNSLIQLKKLPENSVDSIVTDPPYGISFMAKKWDYDVPSVELWRECFRVLKPGGHLLSFAGTRTQHRMAVNIEDAGFEIRDMIGWIYGSGFPKSHNISKGIDKINGETGRLYKFTEWLIKQAIPSSEINRATNSNMGGHYLTMGEQPCIPTAEHWEKIKPLLIFEPPQWIEDLVKRIQAEREKVGEKKGVVSNGEGRYQWNAEGTKGKGGNYEITRSIREESKAWEGWGSAIKPALEPITMARKPLSEKSIAENVLKWGTGGINIDGCRIEGEETHGSDKADRNNGTMGAFKDIPCRGVPNKINKEGRFPANIIHDGSEEVEELFPVENEKSASRFFYCAKASKADRNEGMEGFEEKQYSHDGRNKEIENAYQRNKSTAKNNHPTVKPTDLMRYLVRLVTPPGGVLLDPFMGSGSTGKACKLEGFNFIGIEREAEYISIAQARIENSKTDEEKATEDLKKEGQLLMVDE